MVFKIKNRPVNHGRFELRWLLKSISISGQICHWQKLESTVIGCYHGRMTFVPVFSGEKNHGKYI